MNTLCKNCGHEKVARNLPYGASENTCDRRKCLSFQPSTVALTNCPSCGERVQVEIALHGGKNTESVRTVIHHPKGICHYVNKTSYDLCTVAPKEEEKEPEPISAQIEEFSDLECNGPFCPHEMTNKHYIFTEKDRTQALNDAYKDGQDDGRGEMIMNSQGFIETTILPAEMIEKVKAESHAAGVEEFRKKAIEAVKAYTKDYLSDATTEDLICVINRLPSEILQESN